MGSARPRPQELQQNIQVNANPSLAMIRASDGTEHAFDREA